MTLIVLLILAAAWSAVFIPPLLRSRADNRPNSSVTDFRNQLRSLQHAVPSRSVVPVRAMGRGLAQSPLSRPAAAGRPGQIPGQMRGRAHGGATVPGVITGRAAGPARMHDAGLRSRPARDTTLHRSSRRRRPTTALVSKRRRANILFVLALSTACCLFLAITTETAAFMWAFGFGVVALLGYVYLLGSSGVRTGATSRRAARAARPAAQRAPKRRRSHGAPAEPVHEMPSGDFGRVRRNDDSRPMTRRDDSLQMRPSVDDSVAARRQVDRDIREVRRESEDLSAAIRRGPGMRPPERRPVDTPRPTGEWAQVNRTSGAGREDTGSHRRYAAPSRRARANLAAVPDVHGDDDVVVRPLRSAGGRTRSGYSQAG